MIEIEPHSITFADYDSDDRTHRRQERLYIKNADTSSRELRFEIKLFDKAKLRVSPQFFSLRPEEIKEIIIELMPFSPIASPLELRDFMLLSANNGEYEKRIPIIIQPIQTAASLSKSPQSTSRAMLQLNPEINKTMTLKFGELQERAFEQLLDEKDRLISRLEEKMQRREAYYAQVEAMLRNQSSLREVQALWTEFRDRTEKENEQKDIAYEREIRQRDALAQQREEEIAIVLSKQELAIQSAETEQARSQEIIASLEQQNHELKRQVLSLQREITLFDSDGSEDTARLLADERINQYREEIESIRGMLYAEKQKASSTVLQCEYLQNENLYLQQQIDSAQDRLESAHNSKRIMSNQLSENRSAVASLERARIIDLESKLDNLTEQKQRVEGEETSLLTKYRGQYEEIHKKYSHLQKQLEENEKKHLAIIEQQQAQLDQMKQSQQQDRQVTLAKPLKSDTDEEAYNQANIARIEALMVELQMKAEEIAVLKEQHETDLNNLHDQIDDLSVALQRAQQTNKDNMTARIALIEKIKDKFEDTTKEKDAKYNAELLNKEAVVENLQAELGRKTREITSLTAKLQDVTAQNIAFVKAANDAKESEKKTKKSAQKNPAEDPVVKLKALTAELENRDNQIEELRRELKNQKSANTELEKTAKKKESTYQKKMDELETQKKEFQEQAGGSNNSAGMSQSDQTIKALRQEIKELERVYFQEVENNKQAVTAFHAREAELIAKQSGASKTLSNQLSQQQTQHENVSRRVSELEDELLQLQEDAREMEQRLTGEKEQLVSAINEMSATLAESQAEVTRLSEQHEKLQRRCERDSNYKATFGEELQGVRQFVTQIEDEKEKIAVQMRLKDHQLQHQQQQREQLEVLLREVQSDYQILETQSQEHIIELQTQLEYYKHEADQLNFQHTRVSDKHATLSTDLSTQMRENVDLKKQLLQAQVRGDQLQSQLAQYDKTKNKMINTLKMQLNEYKSMNDAISQERNEVKVELEQLHKEFVQSRNINSTHLSMMKAKFEKELKEFFAQALTKIAFFISKKDALDLPGKFTKLFENFLDNGTAVTEKEAAIKVLTQKLTRVKAKLATFTGTDQQAQKPLPHNKYSIPSIVEHAKTILAVADFEKLSFEMQQFMSIAEARLTDIEALKAQLHLKEEKIKNLLASAKQSKVEWQAEKERADKIEEVRVALQKRVDGLEAQLKQKNIAINQKTEELKEISRINQVNAILREDIKKKEELIESLTSNVANLKENVSRLNKQLAENQRKEDYVNQMQEKYNVAKEAEAQLTQEKANHLQQITSLKNDVLRKELLLKNKQALEEQVQELKTENQKQKEKLSKNKDSIKKLNATVRVKGEKSKQSSQVFDDQEEDVSVSKTPQRNKSPNQIQRCESQYQRQSQSQLP